jgi:hypothetical protein
LTGHAPSQTVVRDGFLAANGLVDLNIRQKVANNEDVNV